MDIQESEPVSMLFIKKELSGREKEGELGYEQAQALEHARNLCTLTPAKLENIRKKLFEFDSLNEETIIKITDVMPSEASTLKAILLKDRIELDDSAIEEIIKLFK